MKIVFCGPPHSGKSVFINNLIKMLPSDSYTIVRACPDGEGNWSNNQNQDETSAVRKKGKFTEDFVENACNVIENQSHKIVLIDVGGIISEENEKIFKHCDSFIILSSSEEKKLEWLEFGEKMGLQCIACLDSALEGNDEIYAEKPYIQGKITGLERGANISTSIIIQKLISFIIRESKYNENEETANDNFSGTLIDNEEFGSKLGCKREIPTEDGIIKRIEWEESSIPKIYQTLQNDDNIKNSVRIYGIRPNFILSAICKALKEKNIQDISTFDAQTGQYIPIQKIGIRRKVKTSSNLKYHIIENEENVFMHIELLGERYTLEDYEKCILPKINKSKNLYLSGRLPNWLIASIVCSYDSNRIFTYQPGNGFVCVAGDEKSLGMLIDTPDGINVAGYISSINKRNTNLPEVRKRQSIFSKLKQYFIQRREVRKYKDKSIKSKIIKKTEDVQDTKSTFTESLRSEVREKDETGITNIDTGKEEENEKGE